MTSDNALDESLQALWLTGRDLLERMVFKGPVEERIAGMPWRKIDDGVLEALFIPSQSELESKPPDIIDEGERHDNVFDSRWELTKSYPALITISCPQLHLHQRPEMMPGPFCDVCDGHSTIQVEAGLFCKYKQICSVMDCDSDEGDCELHCPDHDYDEHEPDSWEVEEGDQTFGGKKNLFITATCSCEFAATEEIEQPHDLIWEKKS